MTISVLVTTYGRREYIEKCIKGLLAQQRLPDEIVIVTRKGDAATEEYVEGLTSSYSGPVRILRGVVEEPGVLPANRVGLPLVSGELMAFIDDDAVARPDWIERILARFAESDRLGGLGGRDVQHRSGGIPDDPVSEVGRVKWYGKVVGFHHLKKPGLHDAEVLKGCNMVFRRKLLQGFDEAIIGDGHHYELDLSFMVRRAGYDLKYDGDLMVDHFVEAPRMLAGNADPGDPRRYFFMNHNLTYVMMKNLGFLRRAIFLSYSLVFDCIATPYRYFRGSPAGRRDVFFAMMRGKLSGLSAYFSRRKRPAVASGRS